MTASSAMTSPCEICINLKLAWSHNEFWIINCICCCCIQPTPDSSMLRFKPCSGVFTRVTSAVYQSQHDLVHVNKMRTLWWRSAVMSLYASLRPPETALSARSSAAGVCAPPTRRSCSSSNLPTSENYCGKPHCPPTTPLCLLLMMCTCEPCTMTHAYELARTCGILQFNIYENYNGSLSHSATSSLGK